MQISKNFLILPAFMFLLGASVCQAADDDSYVDEEEGRGTFRALFERKMETPAKQWEYARKSRNRGHLKKADRRMLYLVRRWPNSAEAPLAARARGDILYSQKKLHDAFGAYQFLIDNYSSRMKDYDAVLQSQFDLAVKIMNHRRMRWIFGGYRAPEYAVPFFENVIRNGPQWSRAPEAQFLIGKCHQDADELELAITAYSVLGYRYPESEYSEEGTWQQIVCMRQLYKEYPSNVELLDRLLTTTTVFLSEYPQSEKKNDVIELRNIMYEVKAGKTFEEAAFYAKVPKKPEAAIIYYEQMIEEYPKSKMVPVARERIEELRKLMALPTDTRPTSPRSTPLPFFGKDSDDADG